MRTCRSACFCRASHHQLLQFFAIYITLSLMKCYRRGPIPSLTPAQVLGAAWRALEVEDMARYLRRVIVAERKSIAGEYPRHLKPRFKWRRLAVASRLVDLGGAVSPRVFTQPNARSWSSRSMPPPNVPIRYSWPSVYSLVPLRKRNEG